MTEASNESVPRPSRVLHQVRRCETPIGVFHVILANATHVERKYNTNYYYLYYDNNHNDDNDNNKNDKKKKNTCFFTSCLGLTRTHDRLECSSFGARTKALHVVLDSSHFIATLYYNSVTFLLSYLASTQYHSSSTSYLFLSSTRYFLSSIGYILLFTRYHYPTRVTFFFVLHVALPLVSDAVFLTKIHTTPAGNKVTFYIEMIL